MLSNICIGQRSSFAILLVFTTLAAIAQKPDANGWKVVGPGGGGTTIGPTISPINSHLVVEHCDMTGGYVSSDDGQSWHMFNLRGGINVLAFDPVAPQVIYGRGPVRPDDHHQRQQRDVPRGRAG